MKTLWDLLGFQLQYTTTFHPQMDGQTEVVNRSLVHALRIQFAKTKQWDIFMQFNIAAFFI